MDRSRTFIALAALGLASLAVGTGCPEEKKPAGATPAPRPTAKPAASAAPKTPEGPAGVLGGGVIKGVVSFTGTAPEMKVPVKRKDTEVCRDKDVVYNAVVVKDGKLADTFVRIEVGGVSGRFEPPPAAAVVDQVDCMYTPRMQGVVAGQSVEVRNGDATLHNVHTYKGSETLFNVAQPKGAGPIKKRWDDGMVKFKCDVHPWMTGFVVVTDHPFFAVSGADGTFTIEKIPAGKYNLEAWHSRYGLKKATVEVSDGKPAEVSFTYDGTEPEPIENRDELKGLW